MSDEEFEKVLREQSVMYWKSRALQWEKVARELEEFVQCYELCPFAKELLPPACDCGAKDALAKLDELAKESEDEK